MNLERYSGYKVNGELNYGCGPLIDYNPDKLPEAKEKSLDEVIKEARGRSRKNVKALKKLGVKGTEGVIVAHPGMLIDPQPGIEVVNIPIKIIPY